jgi:hypothetical protein
LTYLPLSGQLIISDGEVDEMPGVFQGKNLFITSLSGELLSTLTTVAFSQEPTGVAVDVEKNRLFFSDDDRGRIYQVEPGTDGLHGTADDVVTSFATSGFASSDPEGLAFDNVHRHLYVVDGLGEEVFEIDPGPNGTFEGAPGDDLVRHFDTSASGLQDPEGIEYDSRSDLLYVLSGGSHRIGEMSREGVLARSIDISSIDTVAPAGLAMAPASNGGLEMHLYVVDRGIDNNANPDENDGRIYEIAFPPPDTEPTPTSSPAPMQTATAQPIFADVPHGHPYFADIEWLYRRGFTAGCAMNPLRYCPDATMNRAESAVFVERGVHGASYDPPMPSSQVFGDLPLDSWAARWVNGLWVDQYTAGCATNPLMYCPWQGHTRAEGTVLYLRMMHGPGYMPPEPTQQRFVDVPLGTWYAKWVEAAYDVNLISACQSSPELRFCPDDPLSRGLAAYMMFQAKLVPVPTATPPPATATPDGHLIYTSNFETGAIQCASCNPDGWNIRAYATDATLVGTGFPVREGTHSVRVHADKDDPWNGNSPRAELEGYKQPFFNIGPEYWIGFSIYLPDDGSYEYDTQMEILSQIRHRDDPCDASGISPSNALRPSGGRWRWDVRWDADPCMGSNTPDGQEVIDMGPQERGRWTDFLIRVRFSWGNDGMLQVWKDGEFVVDRLGKPNYYNNPEGPYLKIGFYKSQWLTQTSIVTTRTVYYDALRVYEGTNGYAIVAPGQSSP